MTVVQTYNFAQKQEITQVAPAISKFDENNNVKAQKNKVFKAACKQEYYWNYIFSFMELLAVIIFEQ